MNHICFVYIYPLNGYRELNSYEEPCIYANGNAITSFARELNPTRVEERIHIVIHIYGGGELVVAIFPTPPNEQDATWGQILSEV